MIFFHPMQSHSDIIKITMKSKWTVLIFMEYRHLTYNIFSCPRIRFTQIYVTIERKRLSHLLFHVVCKCDFRAMVHGCVTFTFLAGRCVDEDTAGPISDTLYRSPCDPPDLCSLLHYKWCTPLMQKHTNITYNCASENALKMTVCCQSEYWASPFLHWGMSQLSYLRSGSVV